jgi:hypothetical protein
MRQILSVRARATVYKDANPGPLPIRFDQEDENAKDSSEM